jgi:hypothetical protein
MVFIVKQISRHSFAEHWGQFFWTVVCHNAFARDALGYGMYSSKSTASSTIYGEL